MKLKYSFDVINKFNIKISPIVRNIYVYMLKQPVLSLNKDVKVTVACMARVADINIETVSSLVQRFYLSSYNIIIHVII